ncbi:MAG: alpha/beta fold hydrolase [Chlorobiaceae bacterium]|nr:alpha/beta fold hydrolase [Chlorobiaceae bacterium]
MISRPNPAENYESAIRLFETLRTQEPQGMNPLCRNQLLTRGFRTERSIVLVHGYTSAPPQFHTLGHEFFQRGFNVLMSPLPRHGLAERMTRVHGGLTAEELAAFADRTLDVAAGLGNRVTIMGLSMGGVTAAWAAQHRKDLDLSIIISPAFGFRKIPERLTRSAMLLFGLLPDAFVWWDPEAKENGAPSYAYPKYSRHALTQLLRLGFAVKDDAAKKPPAAKKIVMVLNPSDDMVNNDMSEKIAALWKTHGANVSTFSFDAGLMLPHDLVALDQKGQRTDVVYPKLVELAGK